MENVSPTAANSFSKNIRVEMSAGETSTRVPLSLNPGQIATADKLSCIVWAEKGQFAWGFIDSGSPGPVPFVLTHQGTFGAKDIFVCNHTTLGSFDNFCTLVIVRSEGSGDLISTVNLVGTIAASGGGANEPQKTSPETGK